MQVSPDNNSNNHDVHCFNTILLTIIFASKDLEWTPPVQGAGWFRKIGGLIVCWRLGEVRRMRRLLQRWENVPNMKQYTQSLLAFVQANGWPKNLEGEFGLHNG